MSTKALIRTVNSLKAHTKKVTSQIETLAKTQLGLMSNIAVLEGYIVAAGGQPVKGSGATAINQQRIRTEKVAAKKEKPTAKQGSKPVAQKTASKAKITKVKPEVKAKTLKKPVKENNA